MNGLELADHAAERLCSWLGWPYADELASGPALLDAVRGRCDLVLHGHRHTPRSTTLFADEARPLAIFNAGSSTELGRVRIFCHEDGRVLDEPGWLWTWPPPADATGTPNPGVGRRPPPAALPLAVLPRRRLRVPNTPMPNAPSAVVPESVTSTMLG